MKKRLYTALVRVNGYKKLFDLGEFVVRGNLTLARKIVQEQFSIRVDKSLYPRLPYNYTPRLRDIRIVWGK